MTMTRQQIFDTVVAHLRQQGRRSERNGACAYRGEDGAMCAVGCLIPDKLYDPAMEGAEIYFSPKSHIVDQVLMSAGLYRFKPFLAALQRVHDNFGPNLWESELEALAKQYDLIYTPREQSSHE